MRGVILDTRPGCAGENVKHVILSASRAAAVSREFSEKMQNAKRWKIGLLLVIQPNGV